jgi:hypothetical protein
VSDIEFAMSTYADAARKVPAEKRAEAGAWAVWLLARRCAYEDAARAVERGRKCPGCGTANHEALIAQGMLDAAEILRCEPFDRIWDAIAAIELQAEQIRDAADHSGVAGERSDSQIDSENAPTQVPVPDPVDPSAVNLAGGMVVSNEGQTVAARLRRASAGRLECAASYPEGREREILEAEATVLRLAAQVASGDLGPMLGWMPSWRWTDEMTRWALRRRPDEPQLCAICGDDIWPGDCHSCPTCSGPVRETVGMICQTCGTDYATPASAGEPKATNQGVDHG